MEQIFMNLDSRLRKLEDIQKQSNVQDKGIKTFITYDDETYFLSCSQPKGLNPLSPRPINYRELFTIEEKQSFSREDLERSHEEGWTNLVIHYVKQSLPETELIN